MGWKTDRGVVGLKGEVADALGGEGARDPEDGGVSDPLHDEDLGRGGWVGDRWIEEGEAVGMRCCKLGVEWVGG